MLNIHTSKGRPPGRLFCDPSPQCPSAPISYSDFYSDQVQKYVFLDRISRHRVNFCRNTVEGTPLKAQTRYSFAGKVWKVFPLLSVLCSTKQAEQPFG